MAYRKKPYYKKGYRRRYKKKYSSSNKTIWKTIQTLRPERKHLQANFGTPGTGISYSNVATQYILLNGLDQGVATNDRLANKVTAKFIELRLALLDINAIQDHFKSTRVIMYIDKNPRGSKRNLFGSANMNSTTSIYNYDDRNIAKNFKVLFDKTYSFGPDVRRKTITIKRKLQFEADYSRGDAGTIADFETNALYLLIHTDYPNVDTQYYWGNFTFTYTDS